MINDSKNGGLGQNMGNRVWYFVIGRNVAEYLAKTLETYI